MKRKNIVITMVDKGNETISSKKITALPLKEETIIAKSIEFFDDPEPCMIHRSAVMKRLFAELEEFFKGQVADGNNLIDIKDIDENLRNYLDLGDEVIALKVGQ